MAPESVKIPEPPWVSEPLPEMTPRNSVDVDPEIVRVPLPNVMKPVPSVLEIDATFSENPARSNVAPSMTSMAEEL